jgi:aspartyl protease family protein
MTPNPSRAALALVLFVTVALRTDPVRSAEPDADAGPLRAAAAPRESVTIPADGRGFYQVLAQVNGVPVRAVVDTGASAIYLGRAQAAALGLGIDTARARRAEMSTFRGPRTIWVLKLDRVQVGGLVARDVDAWVVEEGDEGPPQPLLGMSFLQRFEVKVGGGAMTLRERARQ